MRTMAIPCHAYLEKSAFSACCCSSSSPSSSFPHPYLTFLGCCSSITNQSGCLVALCWCISLYRHQLIMFVMYIIIYIYRYTYVYHLVMSRVQTTIATVHQQQKHPYDVPHMTSASCGWLKPSTTQRLNHGGAPRGTGFTSLLADGDDEGGGDLGAASQGRGMDGNGMTINNDYG